MYYLNYERVDITADVTAPSERHSSTVIPSYANGTPTAVASSDHDSSSTRIAEAAPSAPNHHIESSKEASNERPKESYKESPPAVPQRGTSVDEFNLAKEWMNKLFGRNRAWSYEEDEVLASLLPISRDDRALLSWAYGLPRDLEGWALVDGERTSKPKQGLLALLRHFPSEIDKWRGVRTSLDELYE
jgi:hypothetical protein